MAYNPNPPGKDPYKGYKGKYSGNQEPYREKKPQYGKIDDEAPGHIKTPEIDYVPERVREKIVISSRATASMQDSVIKPLKLAGIEIIGGIFDRVRFLETRISELRANVDLRKKIHDNILAEIEKDIDDRQQFILVVSDINEKRNLKLDISVLRRERRNEEVQFWRDLVELDVELKKMEEEYEVESKIAGIFNGMDKKEDPE